MFFILTTILFAIWVIRNTLFWVNLWQLKEYRLDRILIHLKETSQGRSLLFSPLALIKWGLIFSYALVPFELLSLPIYRILVSVVFLYQLILVLKDIAKQQIKSPIFTLKVVFVLFMTFSVAIILCFFPLTERFLWLLLIDKFVTFFIGFVFYILSFPTEFYRDLQIERAIKKIRRNDKLLVIGVTGSFGKSSTKEYIAQILSKKFKVVKTRGNNNTPIGIANTILSDLRKSTEVFVVEMGAYKKGEITHMCQIVKPRIGIITSVNDQHLSLFKSLENIMNAKYELVEALPKNGQALFNANNENSYKLYRKTKKRKLLYGTSLDDKPDIYAKNISVKKNSVSFDVVTKKTVEKIKAPLIGAQNVENILPAVAIAETLGMNFEEIKKAASYLLPQPKTMVLHKFSNGCAVIDDTYNANPNAVLAALKYINIYKGKKILVLQPMIELGKNAETDHYDISKSISRFCDYLFLTNSNFNGIILEGIKDGGGKCQVKIGNSDELAELIKSTVKSEDVVVFEGKEAGFVMAKVYDLMTD
ncbi:MAG: UDP-N-acetylmuramoyl-tripeptide--D-alanyl-D-alanine ligase [Patescibacteria group bacterium]|nr:UDP-N-acetylmuramoyl-tripeptide--D-alanyl-D-alanine ligase [Patescibacteria group bacterium]